MPACFWLAVAMPLLLTGCIRPPSESSSTAQKPAYLTENEISFARAMSHYMQARISQKERPPDQDKALEHFKEAARHDPSRSSLYIKTASGFLRKKEYSNAVAIMEEARSKNPDSYEIALWLAFVCEVSELNEKAVSEYQRAIKMAPAMPSGYISLGRLYMNLELYEDAYKILARGINKAGSPEAIVNSCKESGLDHVMKEELEKAIVCYRVMAYPHPNNLELWYVLSTLYERKGDDKQRTASLKKAAAILEKKVKDSPDDLHAIYLTLSELYEDIGENTFAIENLEQASKMLAKAGTNQLFGVHIRLGGLYEKSDNKPKALEHFEIAAKAQPEQAFPHVRIALVYLKDQPEKTVEVLQQAAEKLPDSIMLFTMLGFAHSYRKQFAASIEAFKQVDRIVEEKRVDPNRLNPMFHFWYGAAHERLGNTEQALALLETSLELDPDKHATLNYLAYMWAEQGIQLERALVYSLKSLELDPSNAAYLDTLGWIYYKMGDHEKARKTLAAALKDAHLDATVNDHMGNVCRELGEIPEAIKYWKASLKLDPKNKKVAEKLRAATVDDEEEE